MRVELVYCPGPREALVRALELPPGSRVIDALQAAGWPNDETTHDWGAQPLVGIWGRRLPVEHLLRDGDRVEVHRALRVDPKVARRERFAGQGSRSSGLFAKRRPGSKAGY